EYLLANAQGALVFNTQWEQYPFLYFWNSQSTYLTGIESSIMYVRDMRRYWLWRHIANDEPETCGSPLWMARNTQSIRSTLMEFGAGFVIVERDKNRRLSEILGNMPEATEVYGDAACLVFRLARASETQPVARCRAPQTRS